MVYVVALTLPAIVKLDWLSKASGPAIIPVLPSMKFDPEPPVPVTLPLESFPSAPTGKATTELVWSLVMKYMALAPPAPGPDGGLGLFQSDHGAAEAVRPREAKRRKRALESIFYVTVSDRICVVVRGRRWLVDCGLLSARNGRGQKIGSRTRSVIYLAGKVEHRLKKTSQHGRHVGSGNY